MSGSLNLKGFYEKNPNPEHKLRIPLQEFILNPEETLKKAQSYLNEYGVLFITHAFDKEFKEALESQIEKCVKKMDPNVESLKEMIRQKPLNGVWNSPKTGSFVLGQQEDDTKLDRFPLDITRSGDDNSLGISMAYNPIYTGVNLWALEHRKDLAAILLKLTFPNGVLDRDTCTYIDKDSKGKFDMIKPVFDIHKCERYRAMLIYDGGRSLMFLPKSHQDEFETGKKSKKRKRTVNAFQESNLSVKELSKYGLCAPPAHEMNDTGTMVLFKDVIYFEQGQLRGKHAQVFRINIGMHNPTKMNEKDKLSLAMMAAARDFAPTIVGNGKNMKNIAKGSRFNKYNPVFNGKTQGKLRKNDPLQSAIFTQCKNSIMLDRKTMMREFKKVKPLTRHLMGDHQEEPFAEADDTIKNIWKVELYFRLSHLEHTPLNSLEVVSALLH